MPEIGEIRRGDEIDRKGTDRFIWQACEDCGRERWVRCRKGVPVNPRCYCAKKPEILREGTSKKGKTPSAIKYMQTCVTNPKEGLDNKQFCQLVRIMNVCAGLTLKTEGAIKCDKCNCVEKCTQGFDFLANMGTNYGLRVA